MNVTYTPKTNEPIVHHAGWRAAYIRVGDKYALAAQRPDRSMLFGLLPETGFLVGQARKPTEEQVKAFLQDCIDGKIVERTLADITKMSAAS